METITHKGKVFQVGALYRSAETSEVGYLDGVAGESFNLYMLKNRLGRYIAASVISEIINDIGTIEDAPIELEDGEWYMCADDNGLMRAAYYDGSTLTGGVNSSGDSCLHLIRKNEYRVLYKMVKAES
mgnify:FL=1